MKNFTICVLMCVLVLSSGGELAAQVSLGALGVPATENFNSLASSGTSAVVRSGWAIQEAGTNANGLYNSGTGSSNTGDTYSFGASSSSERALGQLRSGSLSSTIGAAFTNNTGALVTDLMIAYTGEQWRLGAASRPSADRMDFQLSLDATSLTTGSWTDVNQLDFNAPVVSGTVGALPGNDPANRVVLSYTISGLAIPAGATFWIRWTDIDVSGADDGLSIDDFSMTADGIAGDDPTITFTPSSLDFGQVNVGASVTLTYQFDGSNLENELTTVRVSGTGISISIDGITFQDSLAANDSTLLYVRFSPVSDGAFSASLLHSNGDFQKTMTVAGSGYDPLAHLTPIATARTRPVGTKVTVAGRVTSANQLGSPSYVQDSSGGIPVFDFTLSNNVSIGDSIVVSGPIGVFSQQVQISGSGITFFKADNTTRVISPKEIPLGELAANEGLLVKVNDVEIVNKAFVFYPQSTEQMKNGATTADLRIDGDTDIPGLTKPQGIVDIVGVVGRFNASAQLLPRTPSDIPGAVIPQTPADSIPVANTLDIMNWNLEFFGAEREDYPEEFGPADEDLQLANVKQVMLSVAPDVLAVQEVSNDEYFNQLLQQIPGYKGVCSPRWSYSFNGPDNTFPPQKLCFIYDTTTVRVTSTRVMFEQLYDAARTDSPQLLPGIPDDPGSFWSSGRLPFVMQAQVTIQGVPQNLTFINLHTKSGATVSDYNRRQYDMNVLKDSLDTYLDTEKFVILGDLNDDLDQSIVAGRPTPYASLINDSAAYEPITLSLSLAGARSTTGFQDVIDHQVLSNELSENYTPASVHILTPFSLIPNYATTTSDHLPVVSRYEFTAPVASMEIAQSSISEGDSTTIFVNTSEPLVVDTQFGISINGGTATYSADYTTVPAAVGHVVKILVPAGTSRGAIRVASINDSSDEPDETVTFSLNPMTGIEPGSPSSISLTIVDNDIPSITFASASTNVQEHSSVSIQLQLSSPADSQQSVTLAISQGDGLHYGNLLDYSINPTPRANGRFVLNIPAGATSASFQFEANKDLFEERDEVANFKIVSVSSGISIGALSSTEVVIKDVAPCLPVFVVYPNPTTGPVHIWTLPANEDKIVAGSMFDPTGQMIATGNGTTTQLEEIFTTALTGRRRGIYTLKLILCDQPVAIRIIKL